MFRFSVRSNKAHLIKWREWGPEAFQAAADQTKPVFLFLSAFWCGFCQRMDETALSDDEVIALLNAFFVPIRVEESQRPDVDLRYNQGGWPTIAFLTAEGEHLFSVNFMETEPFINLLVRVVELHHQGVEAFKQAVAVSQGDSREASADDDGKAPLGPAIVAEIAGIVEGLADPEHGGYGAQAKFLHPAATEFLLYLYETNGEAAYLDHAKLTLEKMRYSKTFHASAGGFFRYSSKQDWSEPHPEKMLEDQAALLRNYLRAYLLIGEPLYQETAEGLVEFMNTVLSHGPGGGFSGCQDYVRPEGQGPGGGFPQIPVIDEFLYCDANALAAGAYLDAWWLLGDHGCKARAEEVLDLVWTTLRTGDGRMYHVWDGQARAPGLLTDAVETGLALLAAYSVLDNKLYLRRARELAQGVIKWHRADTGGFYDISEPGPAKLRSPMTVLAQNARAARFFAGLADLGGGAEYREEAVWALAGFPNTHRKYGAFAAGFGHALARLLASPVTVTVVGVPGNPAVRAMARAALTHLECGNLVLRFRESSESGASAEIEIAGRPVRTVTDPANLGPELVSKLGRG